MVKSVNRKDRKKIEQLIKVQYPGIGKNELKSLEKLSENFL
jgi:hypothetical protein